VQIGGRLSATEFAWVFFFFNILFFLKETISFFQSWNLNFVYLLVHLEKQMGFFGWMGNYGNVKYMEFSLLLLDLNHGCVHV
jgi:hypothetical protein